MLTHNQKCGALHKTKNCGSRCNFYGGMGHVENKCWKCFFKSVIIIAKILEAFVDNDDAILAQLNRICGFNYNVFSHVRVSKRRIHMNVLVDATPNVERENFGANGDGNDVQFEFDRGTNMI
jgi:hypothetical protein